MRLMLGGVYDGWRWVEYYKGVVALGGDDGARYVLAEGVKTVEDALPIIAQLFKMLTEK